MPHMPVLKIRDATEEDAGLILSFIRKKAAFDGVPTWVEATEEALAAELFGPRPTAFVFFTELDDRIVGFALYFLTFSSFLAKPGIWLDDLFVDENARGQGAGKALMAHLCQIADQNGYARVEWVTAAANEKGLAFYQRNGAKIQETVRVLRLDRKSIGQLAHAGTIS